MLFSALSFLSFVVSDEPVKRTSMSEGDNYRFLAFARIYSGKIKRGQKLYVLGPKHNPAEAIEQVGVPRLHDGCLGLLSCTRFRLSEMC